MAAHHVKDAGQLGRINRGARGVGGRGQQNAPGLGAPGRCDFGCAQLKTLVSRGGQQNRCAIGGAHKMAVAGVAGVGHEDFIALVHQRQAGQLKRCRRARRDHDAAGWHPQAKTLRIPAADGLAQCVQAQGGGVLGLAGRDDGLCCRLHTGRGGEVGLANVQKHHRPVGVRDLAGFLRSRFGHFHHPKRLDPLGSFRDAHGVGFYLARPDWRSACTSALRNSGARPPNTAFTYLWPSVPPKSLASSMHSLSTTRQGTSRQCFIS